MTPPAAPTGLAPTAGDSQVSLAWSHADPGDVDEYVVEYRCPSGSGSYTEDARPTVASEVVSGLTNGVECDFRVAAEDAANNRSAYAGPVQGTPEAAGAFLRLEDSPLWGTGGSIVDLTVAVPQFRPLEEARGTASPALPLDTTGWTQINVSTCTEAAVEAALASISVEETVVDVSACSLIPLIGDEELGHIRLDAGVTPIRKRIVIRGNPTTRTRFAREELAPTFGPGGNIPDGDSGHREYALAIGNTLGAFPSLASWTWDVGLSMGDLIVGSNQAITGVYPGDVVKLGVQLPAEYDSQGRGSDARNVRRVLCARWDDGTEQPPGCAATYGLVANNRLRIDSPLTTHFGTGGPYAFSPGITAPTISHVENSGAPSPANGIWEYIGLENLEFEHEAPYIVQDFHPAVRFGQIRDLWFKNVRFGPWGATKLSGPAVSSAGADGVLVLSSFMDGEVWKPECTGTIASITATNPLTMVVNTHPKCTSDAAWGESIAVGGSSSQGIGVNGYSGNNPAIFIPDSCEVPELRGVWSMRHDADLPDTGIATIDLVIPGIDGTGISNLTPDCYYVNLTQFGDAAVYSEVATSQLQIANTPFTNTRVGILVQGGWETLSLYNDFHTDPNHHAGRGLFDHDGMGSYAWEGNVSNGQQIAMIAGSPANGPGHGPHVILGRNEFVDDGTVTATAYGAMPNGNLGYLLNESSNQDGLANHFFVIAGNVLEGNWNGGASDKLDSCDNAGASDCSQELPPSGTGVYWVNDFYETGNLWKGFDIDAFLTQSPDLNPTSFRDSDATEANEGAELSPSDRARAYWHSMVYSDVPAWWCVESGPFPSVGAPHYTEAQPAMLPSTRRRLGLSCTNP